MDNKSMIIIGAGAAGLATGCYARMNGYRTRIFELHTTPGGVCTAWRRKGYTIDGCIEWLAGCRPGSPYYPFYPLYHEMGILQNNRIQILNEYCSCLDEETGRSLDVTSDFERLARDMKTIAPEDEKVIDEFIAGCNATRVTAAPRPDLQEYLKGYHLPVAKFAERIRNQFLRRCVANMQVSEMPLWLLFIQLGQLADGQLGWVEGGSLSLSRAIAKRYQDLGGEITYGTHVQEILVENNSAAGVRLADGAEHRADVIVSAADGYSTIFQMLKGKYIDRSIREWYEKWLVYPPIHFVSFGVARQFPGETWLKKIMLKEPLSTGGKKAGTLRLRIFNHDPSLAPEGKTVIQVKVETDFDYWYQLQEDRALYEAEKAKLAGDVLRRLELIYPGISSQVEMTDVATPYTLWRYTRNYRGAYHGWLLTPEAVSAVIPNTLPGLANFYMAGQWAQPGGGIPPALYSGRSLVQTLCEGDGKKFFAAVP